MRFLLFIFFTGVLAEEWTDPHDMNPKIIETNSNSDGTSSDIFFPIVKPTKECNCSELREADLTLVYLKRIVGLLVTSTTSNDENTSAFKGKFVFDSVEDYNFLVQFSRIEKVDQNDLKQLDSIMHSAFNRKTSDEIQNFLFNSTQIFLNSVDNQIFIVIGTILFLYIMYYLLMKNFSYAYIWKYFLFVIWIIDYGFRYQALIEVSLLHIWNCR